MPVDIWRPRMARIRERVHPGDSTVRVYPSFVPGIPMLAKLGSELVTVEDASTDVWTLAQPVAENHHPNGYLTEITIRFTSGARDYSAKGQHLKTKEASPEGETEATWDVYTTNPSLWTPANLESADPQPCTISYQMGGGVWMPFWGGFLTRVGDGQSPNGFHELNMTARGGFTTLGWQTIGAAWPKPASTAGHSLITDALGVYAPFVTVGAHVIDGGLQIGADFEGFNRTPRGIIDFVMAMGDELGPLDWYVRVNEAGAPDFWLIIRGRNPTIEIPISSLKAPAKFVKDYEHVKTQVYVKWAGGYVDALSGVGGAVRSIARDFSNQIDNEPLARQVAKMMATNLGTLEAIADGSVQIEYPKPISMDGSPFPIPLIKAGWYASFTGWEGGFPLAMTQIKSLELDHVLHTADLGLGQQQEDELEIAQRYFGKQTKILGSVASSVIPNNIAPPEGMVQQVQSGAVAVGAGGGIGYRGIEKNADMSQEKYVIDGQGSVITAGLKSPPQEITIGGRIVGFRLRGSDGADPPGPGTIYIEVYHASATATGIGTLVTDTPIAILADVKGSSDLHEAPATTDKIVDITPGDVLWYKVKDDPAVAAITNVAITILIQRTGGSSRTPLEGTPIIQGQSMSRNADGLANFTVTINRPCHVQIEFGETTAYGSRTKTYEIVQKTTVIPDVPVRSPFHWRVIAYDRDDNITVGVDQTG